MKGIGDTMSTIVGLFYRGWHRDTISIYIYEDLLGPSLKLEMRVGGFDLVVTLLPWSFWRRIMKKGAK